MCGIAGSVNFKLDYSKIDAVMHHRGPDEQRGFQFENLDLYHLRLAIQDIGGGSQPMHLNNRYSIIFNGEIYNHLELRKKFSLQGNGNSDTETLLLLFQKVGINMLQELDGMFAFALYDKEKNKLFIARDRAGKKPLYYYHYENRLVFASELNALKVLLPLTLNRELLFHYTRLGCYYRKHTPYQHVYELAAGHLLEIDCTPLHMKETAWWTIQPFYEKANPISFETAFNKVDELLIRAVKLRIDSSDLEVGCFLSGGIDSGLVTAIASKYKPGLRTFTVSFTGSYDEAPLANLVAKACNTNHTTIPINFDYLQQDVEKILLNYGEPFFDSSAIPSYYVCREAKKHLTVVLNGDGADELFAGYRRYVPFARFDFFKENRTLKGFAGLIKKMMPLPTDKQSLKNYAYRLVSLASKSNLDIYLSAGVDILEDFEKYLNEAPLNYMNPMKDDFNRIAGSKLTGLQKIMCMDFNTNLCSDLLVKMDIASMAHSLEGRSPFLSKDLLEFVPGLPDAYKIKGKQTKYLLRCLAKKYLPEQIINQPKRGFEIPLKQWVNGELKTIIHDYLGASGAISKEILEPVFHQKLLNNTLQVPSEKRAKMLWMLFSLELWYQKTYLKS